VSAAPSADDTPTAVGELTVLARGYLSLPSPPTIFFWRHLSKICFARVLASARASFGDSAPVAVLANTSVMT
jgi:hypothetical protein